MLSCRKTVINKSSEMEELEKYLQNTLGIDAVIKRLPMGKLRILPLYIRAIYTMKTTRLYEREILLLEKKDKERLTAEQYRKHIQVIENAFNKPVVLVLDAIEAYNRKRLIEKQIAFIIPGKQMFIPQFLIDLREFRYTAQKKKEKIQPAAQCLLLFHLLKENVEDVNLKTIAEKLNYTPMTITRAANELNEKALCRIEGRKEKKIVFERDKKAIWEKALPYLQNPVNIAIYIEEYIDDKIIFESGYTALSSYTKIAGEPTKCFAISKTDYVYLRKHKQITITNKMEGRICLEIWKYNPAILATDKTVDPLSLYLTLKDEKDERVEIELEKMIERLW